MLDVLSNNGEKVKVSFADEEISNANVLIKDTELKMIDESLRETAHVMGGAFYIASNDLSVWLCDVTKFVFGYMPEKIWYKAL